MKLKIVYGRAGTGKSRYVYEDILKNINSKKIYLIVPEQYNLTAEKMLFNITGKKALLNVEVLTLSRMAYRVSTEIGGKENLKLSQAGKNMLIYDILSKERDSLSFLGNSDKNIDIVNRMFTELKKHRVDIEDLKSVETDDEYIRLKLKDIINLYEKYELKVKDSFIDEDDVLKVLGQDILSSDMFENSYVYIDEFLGFTKQEYKVFEGLLTKAEKVCVTVCTDSLECKKMEDDIFYFNKIFANRLISISHDLNYEVEEVCLDNNDKKYKSEEIKFLENNLFFNNKKYMDKTKDIKLFFAKNPYSEIEYIAKQIHNLVKKSGLRYNEIAVITEMLDRYSDDVKVIFKKYDIPVFIDEKKDLNQNVLIKFILGLLDVLSKNFSQDIVISFLKIGLLDIEKEDIYILENYTKKWDIRGNKWFKPFAYEEINDIQERLENIRKNLINPLVDFKNNLLKERTFEEISRAIYKFLIDNNITERLENSLKEFDSLDMMQEYNTSYSIVISLLEEIDMIFKDEKVSFEKYKNIFEIGLNSSDLGKIPLYQDTVILGDTERSRNGNIKVAFLLGLNDGIFPGKQSSEGFLNDKDRDFLKENGIELAKNSIESVFEQEFNFYRTFTLPENKLFITYSSSDKDGTSIRPSILLKKLKRTFINMTEESDVINDYYEITNEEASFEEALKMYKNYLDGKIDKIDDNWKELLIYFYNKRFEKFSRSISGIKYSNLPERLSKKNLDKLYKGNISTSISRVEAYRTCPFSFHLTYGLKLKEKDEMKIKSIDTGSFMHEIIEGFFDYINDNSLSVKSLEDDEVEDIVVRLLEDILTSNKYYALTYSKKSKILTEKLKRVVIEAIKYIVYTLKYSDFNVLGSEIEFSRDGKYEPIQVVLQDGRKVEIKGKIDRVDVAKLNDDRYIRIIDYKSSVRNIDLNKVVAGLNVQLITYLDAISEKENMIPSATLYMSLIENLAKKDKQVSDEDIEKEIKKNFKMQGMILEDVNVVRMMDNKIEEGYSDIVPIRLNKGGTLGKTNSLISKTSFEVLQKKVKDVIKEILEEVLKGEINISPYYYKKNTGCEFCKFNSICMFNTNIKGNEYNIIRNTKKEVILEELENEYKC